MDITINNRELLRNFKNIKMSLKNRQVDKVLINDTDGTKYELTMIESLSPLKHMLKIIKEEGPINITRPEEDIFDW